MYFLVDLKSLIAISSYVNKKIKMPSGTVVVILQLKKHSKPYIYIYMNDFWLVVSEKKSKNWKKCTK